MKRLRNLIHYSLVSQPLSIFRINQSEKSRPEPGTGHLCGHHSEVIFKLNKFDLNKQRRNENEKIQDPLDVGGGFYRASHRGRNDQTAFHLRQELKCEPGPVRTERSLWRD